MNAWNKAVLTPANKMSLPTDQPVTPPQKRHKERHARFVLDSLIRRFRQNGVGFFRTHRWLIVGFLVALMCDALSTVYFMHARPTDGDLHPVVNITAEILGPFIGPLVGFAGKAIAGFCVGIYLRRWTRLILGAAIVTALWATWYNIWGVGGGGGFW